MTLQVLYFSVLRDLTGTGAAEETVPDGSTVADLLRHLYGKHPALAAWDASLLVAVNHTYTRRGEPLAEGDEVALMPPVQGG